ncbi:uncharacterized protein LOC143296325 [Babylonia areolata]|uniref:uncharacterized protein LOC143296325 n=1 Tax=Babylonia areolata TaxID=304850 RepID=UPI003FD2AA66
MRLPPCQSVSVLPEGWDAEAHGTDTRSLLSARQAWVTGSDEGEPSQSLTGLRPPRLLNQYSQRQMQAAIEAVIENRTSVKEAVLEFGVPRSSLYEKLKNYRCK